MRSVSLIFLVTVALCADARAQGERWSLSQSALRSCVSDTLHITWTLDRPAKSFKLRYGSSPDFRKIGGPYRSDFSSFEIKDGDTIRKSTASFTFKLIPLRTGTLAIPGITALEPERTNVNATQATIEISRDCSDRIANPEFGKDSFGNDDFVTDMLKSFEPPAKIPPTK